MKILQHSYFILLFTLVGQVAFAQGSLNALNFSGTQEVISTPVAHDIRSGNFTFEAWVKPTTATGVQAILSNGVASPALYTRTGGALNSGKLGFFWHGTWFSANTTLATGRWQHIAMVRTGNIITFYVNGIADAVTFADATRMSNAPISLGYSGNANENYNGTIDEVRVWAEARTQAQIRANMCSRIATTSPTLKSYWRLDEKTGATAADVSGNNNKLSGIAFGQQISSGAPLGNASAFLYDTAPTKSVTLLSPQGNFTLQSVGNPSAIFLYKVDSLPNIISGLTGIGNTRTYFGAFTVGGTANTYTSTYEYANYPDAVADQDSIKLFERANNEAPNWIVSTTTNNVAQMTLVGTGNYMTKEFFLGGFVNPTQLPCLPPTELRTDTVTQFGAVINWTPGNAGAYNIEYGVKGFAFGSGIKVNNTTQRPFTLTGLQSNTEYDFYVSSLCDNSTQRRSDSVLISFKTAVDFSSIGAGNAGEFAGSNGYAQIPALNLNRNTLSITAWINPTAVANNNQGILFCNDSTTRSGLFLKPGNELAYQWDGTIASAGFSSKLMLKANEWSHVALTISPDSAVLCVNGLCVTNKTTHSLEAFDAPTRFGSISRELADFEGQIDELQLWERPLTINEIRAGMCKKISLFSSSLIGYWSFNQLKEDAVLIDRTGNSFDATLIGFASSSFFVESAAPVGDASVARYFYDNTATLVDQNSRNDKFTVKNIKGEAKGIHLYRIDGVIKYDGKLTKIAGNNSHYGIFSTQATDLSYDVELNYADNFNEPTDTSFTLYTRTNPVAKIWALRDDAQLIDTLNLIKLNGANKNIQFIAGLNNRTATCPSPTALRQANQTVFSATVAWNTGGSNVWNVEYGEKGFALGTGIKLNGLTADSVVFNNLDSKKIFELYVQDTCSTESSNWAGPVAFAATPCQAPTNITIERTDSTKVEIRWDANGFGRWNFEYGPRGFTKGSGSVLEVTTLPVVLDQIDRLGSFDFYISTFCVDGGLSAASEVNSFIVDTFKIACIAPQDISFTRIPGNTTDIQINWTAGPFRKWNLEIGLQGFGLGTGNRVEVISLPYTLSGLDATTTYDVYVASFCENNTVMSNYKGPISFVIDTSATSAVNAIAAGAIRVYPNPVSTGALQLEIPSYTASAAIATLSDIQGKIVKVYELPAQKQLIHQIDVSGFAKGIYILKFTTNKEHYQQKVIIQ